MTNRWSCLLASIWILAALPAGAQEKLNEALHEEIVQITVPAASLLESDRQIVATVFRPDGAGPFPLLVLSHGSPPVAADRQTMGRALQMTATREFVRRGYVVIAPVRRGYGATGGDYAEGYARCSASEFYKAGMQAARDVLAALAFGRSLPYVKQDASVLAGQSAGGFASLAAASLKPEGVDFVLNFSGGRGGDPVKHPSVPCGEGALAETFGRFGASIQVPVLFHYVENDLFFGPGYTRSWFEAFERAGGKGRYVLQAPFGNNGHGLIGAKAALPIWSQAVDEFIASLPSLR
ncbi:alpha/beta hydrolase family protein [Uliginosibacterium paludis]|uniref:CocE/NonD family hydrolase n=1 Tax=Uliginosibacterium paludis TaxID=1615952 RepID=A0ABV2CUX3_9RHOO